MLQCQSHGRVYIKYIVYIVIKIKRKLNENLKLIGNKLISLS